MRILFLCVLLVSTLAVAFGQGSLIQTSAESKLWQAPNPDALPAANPSISSRTFADGTPQNANFGGRGPVAPASSLPEIPDVPERTYPANADANGDISTKIGQVQLTRLSPWQRNALQRGGRAFEHDGAAGLARRHYVGKDTWEARSRAAGGNIGAATRDPCADRCDFPGGYQEAACQDCILRGLVNGWILRSIQDGVKGYNYHHWARNQCVQYAKQQGITQGGATSFSDCYFQQLHETCNL